MIAYSENTLFIGKVLIHLSSVDSTNLFAHRMISKINPTEGTVIWADEQKSGRGQFGSKWKANPMENLTMSVVLNPKFLQVKHQFYLNAAISLAACNFINEILDKKFPICIKWPNDIYIHDKKVAGILIENILKGITLDKCIIGVGLNVNQIFFDPSIPNPISLKTISKEDYNVKNILFQLLPHIERQYLKLKSGKTNELISEYTSRLFRIGVSGYYKLSDGSELTGIIKGVDESGRLLVLTEYGLGAYNLKEITPVF